MAELITLTIPQAFEEQVGQTPDRLALVYEDRHVTYRELNERANGLAWYLRKKGLPKNGLVAVMYDKGNEMIAAMLGILKAGGAFVPLEPTHPEARRQAIVSDISPFLFLTEKKYGARASALFPGETGNRVQEWDGGKEALGEVNYENPCCINSPGDVAHIYYTTGSTGEPKGIMGPHRLILHMGKWFKREFQVTPADRFSQLAVFSYDACLRCIFIPLTAGAAVCIVKEETKQNPAALIQWMEQMKVTIVQTVPSIFAAVLNQLDLLEKPQEYFKGMRCITFAGETLPAGYVRHWMDIYREKPALVNTFGTTETLSKSSYFIHRYPVNPDKNIPIGKGIDNTELLILEGGKLCRVNQEGELYIRSPIMTLGYYKQEARTREVFVQNPLHRDYPDIVYKTGDKARYLPDGSVEYIGRVDTQLKIRGNRVEPGEIESKLANHPRVAQAAVVYRETHPGENALIAFIVLRQGREAPKVKELQTYLGEYLPAYMIPSFFVVRESLPVNNSGKTDRKALVFTKEQALKAGSEYVPPETPVQEKLVRMLQELLEIEKVGIDDNFFEMGGHSLKALQLFSRIHREFNVQLHLRTVWEHPTPREVAALIEAVNQVRSTREEKTESETPYEEILL